MQKDYYGRNRESSLPKKNNSEDDSSIKIKIIVIIALTVIFLILLFIVIKMGHKKGKNDEYTLSVYPDTILVPYGGKKTISYDVRRNGVIIPDAVVNATIVDNNIAKIDGTTITAVNFGKTSVKVVYTVDEKNLCEEVKDVIVGDGDLNTPITNVIFSDGDIQMKINDTYTIKFEIVPTNGFVENRVISSSNTNVVTVDNIGLVKAIGIGNASISIDINNGKFKKNYNVIVSSDNISSGIVVSPTSINIINSTSSLKVGDTLRLIYNVLPATAYAQNVSWYSTDNNVLTVDNYGNVKAIKEGTAKITVETANGVSDSITIQVQSKDNSATDTCGIICINPKYNGSSQEIAFCSAGCSPVGATQTNVGTYSVYCTGPGFKDSKTVICEIGSPSTSSTSTDTCGINCINPKYNGSSQEIAFCSAGCSPVGATQTNVGTYSVYCTGPGYNDSKTVICEIGKP